MEDYPERIFDDGELGLEDKEAVEDMEESDHAQDGSHISQRGRPRIQECWTRVISLEKDVLEKSKTHVVATDLLMASTYPYPSKVKKCTSVLGEPKEWTPLFCSWIFVTDHEDIKPENFKLKDDKLKLLGEEVT